MANLIIYCPRCNDGRPQGTSVPLEKLKHLLDSGEPITVMCDKCRHVWPLKEDEVKSLREHVAAGAFG
jgi:hypothetical protein